MGTATVTRTRSAASSKSQKSKRKPISADEAAKKLHAIIEGHFDEIGLSEAERDERYARADKRMRSIGSGRAKS